MKRMSKLLIFTLLVVFFVHLTNNIAIADDPADIIGTWYLVEFQDLDYYPGVKFKGNGDDESFIVYKDGNEYIKVENGMTVHCSFENGVLDNHYKLEDNHLIYVIHYDDKDHAIMTYAREPLERKVGYYRLRNGYYSWYNCEKIKEFDGSWVFTLYGENGAFVDVAEMNMEGKAIIDNGHLLINWSHDGIKRSKEIVFDETLNMGRLYTVQNGTISYIVTMVDNNTILLNVGLNEAQWVFSRDR